MTEETRITWDKPTEEKLFKILESIPDMIRGIAEARVCRKAEDLVRAPRTGRSFLKKTWSTRSLPRRPPGSSL